MHVADRRARGAMRIAAASMSTIKRPSVPVSRSLCQSRVFPYIFVLPNYGPRVEPQAHTHPCARGRGRGGVAACRAAAGLRCGDRSASGVRTPRAAPGRSETGCARPPPSYPPSTLQSARRHAAWGRARDMRGMRPPRRRSTFFPFAFVCKAVEVPSFRTALIFSRPYN